MDREWRSGWIRLSAARIADHTLAIAFGASLLLGVAATPGVVHAQASGAAPVRAQTSRVRGTVFDSLTKRPVEGATVFVSGSNGIAVTNEFGRFDIDSVPVGKRRVTFTTAALDSLGLFSLGADVDVQASRATEVGLATPSMATLWRALCPRSVSSRPDSGIVYGSVVNAENDQRLHRARVSITWWDISKQDNAVAIDRPTIVAQSDSVGNYYACGLPAEVNLSMGVEAGLFSGGTTDVMLESTRLLRRDLLVSSDMRVTDSVRRVAGAAVINDGLGIRRRGTATVRGEVRDAKGALVPNALVTLPSADTSARTGEDGRFVLGGLPAGTQQLRVRKLGNGPLVRTIGLRPNATLELSLVLPPATVLAAVNVRADRSSPLLREFEDRRRAGFGYYLGVRELQGKPDIVSALQGMPSMQVTRRAGTAIIQVVNGARLCSPSIFLDGRPSSVEEITMFRPEEFTGLEIYARATTVPARYQSVGNACGAVLAWSKQLR